jgi:hypothetical protein
MPSRSLLGDVRGTRRKLSAQRWATASLTQAVSTTKKLGFDESYG